VANQGGNAVDGRSQSFLNRLVGDFEGVLGNDEMMWAHGTDLALQQH
jgi:hypothetical protein